MRALTVGITFAGSYCRLTPSMYLISTVHQCHRYFSSTAIEAARRYPNLDEYYQKNACKFWDNFYKRHKNKFFKDRHYLEKDWGQYFSDEAHSSNGKVVLEVGCGAGNTIFPLVAAYPKVFVHACDISPHAIALVKSHMEFKEDRVNAFVYDVTVDNLLKRINPSSVDVITLIFVLSAVSPYKMPLILQNIKRVLKPGGHVLLRDYAVGDFAQGHVSSGLLQEEVSEMINYFPFKSQLVLVLEETITSSYAVPCLLGWKFDCLMSYTCFFPLIPFLIQRSF